MSLSKLIINVIITLAVSSISLATSASKYSNTITLHKNNTVVLNDKVSADTVAKLMLNIKKLDSILPSKDPIYLVINSPGGSIDAGIELIERLKNLNRTVHTISLFSASMAFQIVQGLGTRYITENGTLMSHKPRGSFSGEFPGQLDARYTYYLKRVSRLDAKVVARTNGKHTAKSYAALIENEFWCDGNDCLEEGLVDKIITAKCDKTLDGVITEEVKFIFFGHKVTLNLIRDACPLNTGIIDYDVTVDNVKLTNDNINSHLTEEQYRKLNTKIQQLIENKSQRTNVIKY